MIRFTSALAQSIERWRELLGGRSLADDHPLIVLSGWEQVDPAWRQLARTIRCKPEHADGRATDVLFLVLETWRKAASARGMMRRRQLIIDEYADLRSAVDLLRRKFCGPDEVRIVGERVEPTAKQPQSSSDSHEVKQALAVMRVHLANPEATGPAFNHPGAEAFAERLRIQRDAPRELDRMRLYLEREMDVLLSAYEVFPSSRKGDDANVGRRAFALMLGDDLQKAFDRPCNDFVTAVTTVLFYSDDISEPDNVLHIEAVKAVRRREKARRSEVGRRGGVDPLHSGDPGSDVPESN